MEIIQRKLESAQWAAEISMAIMVVIIMIIVMIIQASSQCVIVTE